MTSYRKKSKDPRWNSNPVGRPPLPDGERRDYTMRLRLSESERVKIDRAAMAQDELSSTWARERLVELAEWLEEEGFLE